MQGKRTDRVSHLIQMELSETILTRAKDPRLNFVTVTFVEMANDLKSAVVYYSVIGDRKARLGAQAAFEKAKGFFQKRIGEALKLRYTPKLLFRYDDSLNQGMAIDKVLRDLSDEKDKA